MKKYINVNTEKIMNATNGFEKYFFKLMINSVYGKMKKHWKRINVKFTKKNQASQHTLLINFWKEYAAIHEIKTVLILNKPIYVGLIALDLSKWKMYDFHYNFIKTKFDAELLFTDTDRLTYEIKSENVYEEFFKWKDLFDYSNYSKDSKNFWGD